MQKGAVLDHWMQKNSRLGPEKSKQITWYSNSKFLFAFKQNYEGLTSYFKMSCLISSLKSKCQISFKVKRYILWWFSGTDRGISSNFKIKHLNYINEIMKKYIHILPSWSYHAWQLFLTKQLLFFFRPISAYNIL